MIHTITSDLPSFKSLTFQPGLNILLADKSEGATDRQSRNGAGKTSLVELIHFLMGGTADKDSIFRSAALAPWTFEMCADIGDAPVNIGRSGSKPSRVHLDGPVVNWPVQPERDAKTGEFQFSNDQWRLFLGRVLFGLSTSSDESNHRFGPTFRSLFSYFARRQNSVGMLQPTQHAAKQQAWDQQVAVSYLLGLDAHIPQEFQKLRTEEKAIAELRKAAKDGVLGRYFSSAADLRTRVVITEARVRRMKEQLATFRVVPAYAELEKEASTITRQISSLSDENTSDRELILQLQDSLTTESPPAVTSLERVYREAQVVLPDTVSKRFAEIELFHQAIVQNRKAHLGAEISSAELRITERERTREQLDIRRQQVMGILQSGGALEHYALLQEEASRAEAEAEGLKQRLVIAERIESTKAELEIERARLHKALQEDQHERRELIDEAVLIFEDLSNALYEKAGILTISATHNGPSVEVRIDSQRSKGITNMQIFCFDLMLADLATRRGMGPGFLVHDSHLFDGVDERQIAKALQLGADHAKAVGYQYIVTMNSDALPKDGFRPGFDIGEFICPVRLTDATNSGGLFGLRFD